MNLPLFYYQDILFYTSLIPLIGIFLLIFELLILLAVGSFLIFFCLIPLFTGAPYVKSKKKRMETKHTIRDKMINILIV